MISANSAEMINKSNIELQKTKIQQLTSQLATEMRILIESEMKAVEGTAKKPENVPLAMRAPEAAKSLGISTGSLYDLAKRRIIPHVRLGEAIIFPVDSLRDWLKEKAQTDASENREK